jgi:DUF1016 N-terminal domain
MKRPVKSAKTQEYALFLGELKQRIALARLSAARAVNQNLILLYWDIGRGIVEKQKELGWGESVVELLSRDLQLAFPGLTGFSAFNLWRMRQFYVVHSSPEFLAQLVPVMQKASSGGEPKQILAQLVPELLAAIPWWNCSRRWKITRPVSITSTPRLNLAGAGTFCLIKLRPELTSVRWRRARRTISRLSCRNISRSRRRRR